MAGKNKIMQAVVSFAGTIDPSLGKAMDNVAGHLDKVNWKAVAVGAAVGGIAVATGKAVVEAGKYLAELGDDYNKAMIQKGKISSVEGKADRNGDKTTARVLPSTADSMVTRPLTIPWYLRGEMGNLTPGTEVAYAMFEDGTGIILSRMDGEWDGIVPGDITVKKGALTMQDKGISVPSADVTATGISLTGHTHTDSMGGGTSGPQ